MQDLLQTMRYMQMEKVTGELKALKASFYNSMDPDANKETRIEIDNIIDELRNLCG